MTPKEFLIEKYKRYPALVEFLWKDWFGVEMPDEEKNKKDNTTQ